MKTLTNLMLAVVLAGGLMAGCGRGDAPLTVDGTKYVDPMIGTGFHGHTFPGATRPYAMVQLSPDTHLLGWEASSGYHYDDNAIYAFSHTHLSGTGIGDLGDVALLPYSHTDTLRPVATFSKHSERAVPGYYAVHLDNYAIDVELTSTDRVGFHRYTYADTADRRVMLDLGHILQPNWGHKLVGNTYSTVNDSTVEGTLHTQGWAHYHAVSYRIEFSEPIVDTSCYIDGKSMYADAGRTARTAGDLKFHYRFAAANRQLMAKVALSMVDTEGAARNMEAELPGWDFDAVRSQSAEAWRRALGAIAIEADSTVKTIFYTALYHTMIAPYAYQDVDGRYRGMDKQVHQAEEGYTNYSVFSLWDTFRAFQPLATIINPGLAADWGKVLVRGYKEGGLLPKWPIGSSYTGCMVGYPAVAVLADLACKGLADTADVAGWAEAAAASSVYRADMADKFRGTRELDLVTAHPYYKEKYGYVPADSVAESVSWGLEMAYEDWCVAQLAQRAGLDSLAAAYTAKGQAYKRYLDPETKMMRPVMGDGTFRTPFNPRYSAHMKSDYTEGNAFQWSFFVPHAMDDFIATIGGRAELEARLDTLFTTSSQVDGAEASGDITGLIGQYAHGNEPSHHMAYLYNWTDAPWKGQERLDQIMRQFYTTAPDGIIGNEDCGQMSAWYVMSALGIYQVAPGVPVYALGRPMVDRAVVHVEHGDLCIEVKGNSPEAKYVGRVLLNGRELPTLFVDHSALAAGGTLVFEMTSRRPAPCAENREQ